MDVFEELESMASHALDVANYETDDLAEAAARWQALFGYSSVDAERLLTEQRAHPELLAPQGLWEAVQSQQESSGHDHESYAHWLHCQTRVRPPQTTAVKPSTLSDQDYLVKIESPLTAAVIQRVGGLASPPQILAGASEEQDEAATFCLVNGNVQRLLLSWLTSEHPLYQPLFVPHRVAPKTLCAHTIAPMLGRDATLPQHRLDSVHGDMPSPQQEEYPVRYFFYGTLASNEVLRRLFQDDDDTSYELTPATVRGGKLIRWRHKYNALVDDPQSSVTVNGHVFTVETKAKEDALRAYETHAYEVVRCLMDLEDGTTSVGCTFRFRGENTNT